jgi:hypothetical protein
MLSAKALPSEIRSAGEFENWFASLRRTVLSTATLAIATAGVDLPRSWEKSLADLPSGYVAVTDGPYPRLVRCKGTAITAVSFRKPLPAGTIVVVLKIAA